MRFECDLAALTVRELVSGIHQGRITPSQVARAFLCKIVAQPSVHAWEYLDKEYVEEQARALDDRASLKALVGIPIGVKDVIDTFDMPTQYGTPIHAGRMPAVDASCVAICRSLEAVIMGKTATAELAGLKPALTVNPRSVGAELRTPGGSSSGSAAAVAANMVPLALGTQTAGSIIRPAAYCGVVGCKPTFGIVSTAGVKHLAPTMDTVGAFGRCVDDVAYFLSALLGYDIVLRSIKGLRVGAFRTRYWKALDTDGRAAYEAAIGHFQALGCQVRDAELPFDQFDLNDVHNAILLREASHALLPEMRVQPDKISRELTELILRGQTVSHDAYVMALRRAAAARRMVGTLFAAFDVLLAPSATGEAPVGLESTGNPIFNRLWSLLGNPCVHVPLCSGSSGMPVGASVIGPLYGESVALSAAWMLEQHVLA